MKKTLSFFFSLGIFSVLQAQTTILSQDFSSSAVVADYVSSSAPTASQFNSISTSGAGTVLSITGGKLQFARTGNAGAISRTTDLSLSRNILAYKMKLAVTGSTTAVTNIAAFQFGSGFGTANSTEANASVFMRFGVNTTTTNGTYTLRNLVTSTNTASLVGEQDIYFVMNTSATLVAQYTDPNGVVQDLAVRTADLWAGTTRVFSAMAPTTATILPTDFKFALTSGVQTITIDDVAFTTGNAMDLFPIELKKFDVKALQNSAQLVWQTASERDNAFFAIEHSRDGQNFENIGQIKGAGTTTQVSDYNFTHETASNGINYYRLRQIDVDGKSTTSPIRSVLIGKKEIRLFPTAASQALTIQAENDENQVFEIFNLQGQKTMSGEFSNIKNIDISELSNGIYVLKVNQQTIRFTKN